MKRSFIVLCVCALSLICNVLTLRANQAQSKEARPLKLNAPVESDLSGSQKHFYSVKLEKRDFVNVIVDQRNIDVLVSLSAPDGQLLAKMDSKNGRLWRETLSCIAEVGGTYSVVVEAQQNDAGNGHYTIHISELRATTEPDQKRIQAEKALSDGRKLFDLGESSLPSAAAKFAEAVSLWHEMGERYWEAVSLTNLGWTNNALAKNDHALAAHTYALTIYRELKDRVGEGKALNGLGSIYRDLNEHQKARDCFQQALAIRRELKDRVGEASILGNIGSSYSMTGEYQSGIPYYQQALTIWRELKNRAGEASSLDSLAMAHYFQGSYEECLELYGQTLPIQQELQDRDGEATSLQRMSWAYGKLEQNDKAIHCLEQAIGIRRELRDHAGEASALSDLASVHSTTKQYQKASDEYQRTLAMQRELKNRLGEARTLNSLGFVSFMTNECAKAVDWYEQSLNIYHELKRRADEASTLSRLGDCNDSLKNYEQAIAWHQQALVIQRELKDRAGQAMSLDKIGYSHFKKGSYRTGKESEIAIECYEQALAMERELNDKAGEARILDDLGFVYYMTQQFEKAINLYNQSLTVQRGLRDRDAEARTLDKLADGYIGWREYEKAIVYSEQSLAIRRERKDRVKEAATLRALGNEYGHLKQFDASLNHFEQALAIMRELKDPAGEADVFNFMASMYFDVDEYQKATSFHERSLTIARDIQDRAKEAACLAQLGKDYIQLSQYERAIGYLEKAIVIRRELKDADGEREDLQSLGQSCLSLGLLGQGIAYIEQALKIARDAKSRSAEGQSLILVGGLYAVLGRGQKAVNYLDEASNIARELKDSQLETGAIFGRGLAQLSLRQQQKAIDSFQEVLSIARETKNRSAEGAALLGFVFAYITLNQPDKVIEYSEQVLTVARETKQRSAELTPLTTLGIAYVSLKRFDKAAAYLEQALVLARELKSRQSEATVLGMLMICRAERQEPRLAIILGKKSVNLLQEVRTDLHDINQSLEQSFIQRWQSCYRYLADLLVAQGRLPEAQQVLGLLKQQEYFEFVRRDAGATSLTQVQINFTAAEAEMEKEFSAISGRIAEIGAQHAALLALSNRSAEQEKKLSELESQLESANQAFQKFLDQLDLELSKNKPGNDVATLRESQALMTTLRELNAVALYTIVGKDKYRVILITPDVQKAYEFPITEADLNKKIYAFREVLQDPHTDPRPQAEELYRILIGPELARDIAQTKAPTIMWSLDGTLRYLPVAALHDGQKYLVENYRNVVFTLASREHLKDPVSPKWQALGVGVSREREVFDAESKTSLRFPALPGVRAELSGIVRQETSGATSSGILEGKVMLDDSFTVDALKSLLRLRGGDQPYKVVHIASHFNFQPGDETKSFLLLGDGTLSLARLKSMSSLFDKVELLTLSACNTATGGSGEGKEVEGFAVLAQRQGAEAIIATLWPVSDSSTSQLMQQFYRLREATQGTTKAEALRQAQLALLHGELREPSENTKGARASLAVNADKDSTGARFVTDPQRPFAHPYYWAPFILIGNWK